MNESIFPRWREYLARLPFARSNAPYRYCAVFRFYPPMDRRRRCPSFCATSVLTYATAADALRNARWFSDVVRSFGAQCDAWVVPATPAWRDYVQRYNYGTGAPGLIGA